MKKAIIKIKGEDLKKKLNLKDGYTPIKGKDYFDGKNGEKGERGADGKTPDTDQIISEAVKATIEAIKPLIPHIQDIENNLPMLGERIRDALELLQGDERLDISAIKGLSEILSKIANPQVIGGGGAGVNLYINGARKGKLRTINISGSSVSYYKVNGLDTINFSSVNGTWNEEYPEAGDVDGVNKEFTFSHTPAFISLEGQALSILNGDYSVVGNVITLANAPIINPPVNKFLS